MRYAINLALCSAAFAAFPLAPALAQSSAEALVIFSNGPLTVIGADGQRRAVSQGEHLKDGDRLITPPGTLGQLKLPDGSLVSARPNSEIRLNHLGPGADRTVLELGQGSVRVINIAAPAGAAPRPVDIVTPVSTMQLTRGDGEAFHVQPGAQGAQTNTGTYNRLQAGEAIVRTRRGDMPLQGQQISFSPRADAMPTAVAALPPDVARQAPPMPGTGQPPRGAAPADASRPAPAGAATGQDQGLALSGTTSLLTERSLVGPNAGQGSGARPDVAPGAVPAGSAPVGQPPAGAAMGQAAGQPGAGPFTGAGQRPQITPMPGGGMAQPRPQPPSPPPPRIVPPPGNTGQPGTRPPGTVLPPR